MTRPLKKEAILEDSPGKRGRVVIAGFGNILMGDDGIGVRVVEALGSEELPENVVLLDGGTAPLDTLDLVGSSDVLIAIDAVEGGQPPGTLYKLTLEDVGFPVSSKGGCKEDSPVQGSFSLHELGILEGLKLAAFSGRAPASTLIYGIEPGRVCEGLQLSEAVKESIPRIVGIIINEGKRLVECAGQ